MADKVGPTLLGKIIGFLFIIACIAGAIYFFQDTLFPTADKHDVKQVDMAKFRTDSAPIEAPDTVGITTVSEYKYIPSEKLPPVKGVSAYKWDPEQRIVQFPINLWIGWQPVIAANKGFAPNKDSVFYQKFGFRVNFKLIDDPVVARDAYVSGESHIMWCTLDMMVLFAPELMKDSRTAPRIYQLVDWSNGGDGIVVRDSIKSVADLKGKTIVYAQNSPSQYFINNLLLNAGIQPAHINHKYTASAFEAAAAFVSDSSIDGCVSWAPDIYNIPEKIKGTRILSSTKEANKLLAGVYAVRADFAKDHPEIVAGLVEGIFEGVRLLQDDNHRAQTHQWMAEGYGVGVQDIIDMQEDARIANMADNKDFFLNANSPTNFERTWKNITFVYRELGLISTPIRFDEVMDFSIVKKLDESGKFKDMQHKPTARFAPTTYRKIQAEKPILTQTIRINFFPNSSDIYEPQRDAAGNKIPNTLYDPHVNATVEKAGRLAGQFDRAVIAVVGHTDSSMKGRVPRSEVEKLSYDRANAVKNALIAQYQFDENKFVVQGMAWDEPADPAEPLNQALNRRVEISIYPPEQ